MDPTCELTDLIRSLDPWMTFWCAIPVQKYMSDFLRTLLAVQDFYFPKIRYRPRIKQQPAWLNTAIAKKMTERDAASKISQRRPAEPDLKREYRNLVREVDRLIGSAKHARFSNLRGNAKPLCNKLECLEWWKNSQYQK